MRLLFLADIHIKDKHKGVPSDWLETRWNLFLAKFVELQASADYCILGGDLFDTAMPTPIETRRYFELVQACNIPSVITTGNHEQKTKKYNILEDYAQATIAINPLVSVVTEPETIFGVDILPYQYIKEPTNQSNVLITHVRGEIPPHVKPEVDLDLYSKYKLVLAGDLHAHSNSQLNIVYPGSPYTTSFHRKISKGENGAIIVDLDNLDDIKHIDMELPQLLRYTITSMKEVEQEDFDFIQWELEGDMSEVAGINDPNVRKKPKATQVSAQLDLTGSSDLVSELDLYFDQIEQLNATDKERVINTYVMHSKG
jgi:DNA repair exonuclease SbcCD nuclease subunit